MLGGGRWTVGWGVDAGRVKRPFMAFLRKNSHNSVWDELTMGIMLGGAGWP